MKAIKMKTDKKRKGTEKKNDWNRRRIPKRNWITKSILVYFFFEGKWRIKAKLLKKKRRDKKGKMIKKMKNRLQKYKKGENGKKRDKGKGGIVASRIMKILKILRV